MPQLNLYVDEATHQRIKKAAHASGMSLSKWVTEVVREKTASEWPPGVLALAGAWKHFPTIKKIRRTKAKDFPREAL
ncbi:MAG: CopG family transcriptional regulator [Burkholderiales bacterium]